MPKMQVCAFNEMVWQALLTEYSNGSFYLLGNMKFGFNKKHGKRIWPY
ncbi:hypothetical protein DYY66_2508 [Candidatus Nitrosotalea sp. FS]|nr:hypothetical protein [Candidatus Nitrosotalea sp. FS]